jgi:hypothetical protein
MEESLDHDNKIPQSGPIGHPESTSYLSTLLDGSLLDHDVASIANDVVARYGSEAMRGINNDLNCWRRNWDARRLHDVHAERNTHFSHPLNFWILAKLFVVLHFFRHYVPSPTDHSLQPNRGFFAFSSGNDGTTRGKIKRQAQVVDWLSRIRRQQDAQPLMAECFMSQVINTC